MSAIGRLVASIPDGSVAPADDRLFAPNTLSSAWLVAGVAALVVGAALAVWVIRPGHRRIVTADRSATVHDVYLHRIDELGGRLADGELDERHLHHELSRTLRSYATETGTDGADAMSAAALDAAGRRPAAEAVRTFERPQFAESAPSDPARSLHIARAVVVDDRDATIAADTDDPADAPVREPS